MTRPNHLRLHPKEKVVQVNFYLPPTLYDWVGRTASSRRQNRSKFIRVLLERERNATVTA